MKILVLNCGSSSIKYKLYDMNNDQVLASGGVERIGLDNAFIKVALPNGEKKQIMHDMPDHKEGVNFVYVRRITDDAQLEDIYIYTFDEQRNLTHLKHANQAQYSAENNQWQLRQVNNSAVSKEQITTTNRLTEDWATSLTPDKLGAVSLRPTSLSISGLYEYIAFLKQTGQDSRRFELTYWRKILQPLSVGVMMMLALSFIFGSLRSVTAGARIVTGICFGFLFYVVNEIFGQMSVVFNAPAFLGALMPSLLFMAIIWWLLARKRD